MKKHKNKEYKKSSNEEDDHHSKKKEKKYRDDSDEKSHDVKMKHKKRVKKKRKYNSDEDAKDKDKYKKSKRKNYSSTSEDETDNTQKNKKVPYENLRKPSCKIDENVIKYQRYGNSDRSKSENFYDSKPGSSKQAKELYSKKYEKEKTDSDSESSEDSEGNSSDFTYLKYKHELNRALSSFHLIQDTAEFWVFVQHFETLEKLKKQQKNDSKDLNSFGVPNVYDKTYRLNFSLKYSKKELFLRVQDIEELTDKKLLKFKEIITIYLDFKHKEKFQKLLKLRKDQANLPVAQYKDEIINAVRKERVVIIAGDTGCGKSTQVPQYLYTAGFGKIGK